MATIHHTTLTPSKIELLTAWLPERPWFRGAAAPRLHKSGGFRLDDPQGEVGIEIHFVTDTADPTSPTYVVPLTYRGERRRGADHELVGISMHGILGERYFYDATSDPVFVGQLTALGNGSVRAQHQDISDVVEESVSVTGPADTWNVVRVLRATDDRDHESRITAGWRGPDGVDQRGVIAFGS